MNRIKELLVYENIVQHFPDLKFISNTRIHGGISKNRPDILVQLKNTTLIIEVDEFAHDFNNQYINEQERIQQLFHDNKEKKLIILRFNPDGINQDIFGTNEYQRCIVKKSKEKEWNEQLGKLRDRIKFWVDEITIPVQDITTEYLFY